MKTWRIVLGVAMFAGSAPAASAQFTTVVVPPRQTRQQEAPAQVAQREAAARDTTVSKRLTDMKAWVDSAAVALNVPTPAAPDSARAAMPAMQDTSARARTTTASAGEVTSFKDGSPAPNTATPLPFFALLGAGSLLAGAWLRRR